MNNAFQGRLELNWLRIFNNDESKDIPLEDIFVSITIYEDIFKPYKTGKIVVEDTNELQVLLPLIGGEKLEVSFSSVNDQVPTLQTYRVYKMEKDSSATSTGSNRRVLVIYFISEEGILDSLLSISQKFKGAPESVIQNILKKYLKTNKDFLYTSGSQVDFVSNFWTPSQIFNFISKSTTAGNSSDYLFFEDRENFIWKPVSKLMEQPAIKTLNLVESLDVKWDPDKFQRYTVSKHFDVLKKGKSGGFGNTVFSFRLKARV